jgi:hypothetical protein
MLAVMCDWKQKALIRGLHKYDFYIPGKTILEDWLFLIFLMKICGTLQTGMRN